MHNNEIISLEIQKTIDDFNESTIVDYYEKYGDKRGQQNALSSLRAKTILPKLIKKKTRSKLTKEILIKGHELYWDNLGKLLQFLGQYSWKSGKKGNPLSWGLYLDLCKEYELEPSNGHDKTIKNLGPSIPIWMYRLVEIPKEIYNSKYEAGRILFGKHRRSVKIYSEDISTYEGKRIPFQLDVNGRMIRCKLTGNSSEVGKRDKCNEVQVYQLVLKLVSYSNTIDPFPSTNEIYRYFENAEQLPSVRAVISKKIYQSMGFIFSKSPIEELRPIEKIKKQKKIFQNILVSKLILVPYKIYDSIGWAKKDLFGIGRGKDEERMFTRVLDCVPNFEEAKKIPFYTDNCGNRWMFVRTGKKTLVWPNASKTADEIHVYKLEEEYIKYSDDKMEFPSEDEIFERFQTIYSIKGCIKGDIFHSKGLKFKIN